MKAVLPAWDTATFDNGDFSHLPLFISGDQNVIIYATVRTENAIQRLHSWNLHAF